MLDAGLRDAQRRARYGGEPDQGADLDMVGLDRIAGAAKRRRAVHDDGVGADALDLCAERDQEMREVLHMRLGGGVAQERGAVGGDRCDQRVFGGGDARFIEEYVGALQLGRAEFQPVRRGDGGAQLLEGKEMRVEASPADDIAAGRRQRHLAAAGQQRPGQQDRGADPRAEFGIEIGGANFLGVDRQRVACLPLGGSTDRADQFDQRFGIADARYVFQRDRMLGEQGGGDDRQRGILVAGRLDRSREPVAAFNDVLNGRHWRVLPHTSTLALSELSWMNSRRGSTTSPISLVKMSSASSTSLIFTCSSERSLVSRVVSQSWPGFISPRPL